MTVIKSPQHTLALPSHLLCFLAVLGYRTQWIAVRKAHRRQKLMQVAGLAKKRPSDLDVRPLCNILERVLTGSLECRPGGLNRHAPR